MTEHAEQQPGRAHLRLAVVLGAFVAFGPLSIDMYLPALPELTADLHASTSAVQLTLTGCLLGLAVGQLVVGPISDVRGRLAPLKVGLGLYVLASIGCALSTDVWLLAAFRLLQGLGGAAGIVLARAIARDQFSGPNLVKFFAMLSLVSGLAPILAPVIGGQVLHVAPWPGIFVVLAVIAAVLLIVVSLKVIPETLPPSRRHPGGLRNVIGLFGSLLCDRRFVCYVLAGGLSMGAMFAYIAGSPFLLENIHGLSPQMFSACFGLNALGIAAGAQFSGRMIHRFSSFAMLTYGVTAMMVGSVLLLIGVILEAPLWYVVVALFIAIGHGGFVFTNSMSLALHAHGEKAGSASALFGLSQFVIGAAVAPLVGLKGETNAVPLGIVMVTCTAIAVSLVVISTRFDGPNRPETVIQGKI